MQGPGALAAPAPADPDADAWPQGTIDQSAAHHDLPVTPALGRSQGLRDDILGYYARCCAQAGHRITPNYLALGISTYVADSEAQAVREMGPTISTLVEPCSATVT